MSRTNWTLDDVGDLVNLSFIETICVQPILEDDSRPNPEATHELLAITPDQRAYRLGYGTEANCKHTLNNYLYLTSKA